MRPIEVLNNYLQTLERELATAKLSHEWTTQAYESGLKLIKKHETDIQETLNTIALLEGNIP